MAVAGSLIVEIGANVAALRKDMDSCNKEIEKFRSQSARQAKDIQDRFGASIAGIKSAWISGMAAVGTAIYGIKTAWNLVKLSAEYEEQRGILNNLATKYNMTADGIVSAMQRASDGLVSKSNLMQVALEGVSKGLNPDQLIKLADAATILGDRVGKDATTALQELTAALETGRTKGLKTYLGTALDLEGTFGDLAGKMNAAEKAQAMYAITILEASKAQAMQKNAVSETADKMERMEARFQDTKLAVADFSKKLVVATADFLSWLVTSQEVEMELDLMAKKRAKGYGLSNIATGTINRETEARNADVKAAQEQIEALKKLLKARADENKKTKEQTTSIRDMVSWYGEEDEAIRKIIDDVERGMEATAKGFDEIRKSEEEAILASDDFFAGVRLGYQQSLDYQMTWAKGGLELFNTFSNEASSALSSNLFDVMKGDFDNIKEAWGNLWDAMLKKFADIIGQMVVQWAMGQAAMAANSAGLVSLGSFFSTGAGTTATAGAAGAGAVGAGAAAEGSALAALGPWLASLGLTYAANATTNATVGESGTKRDLLTVAAPFFDPIGSAKSIRKRLKKLKFWGEGGVFAEGSVVPFAYGDVVDSPTIFPMRGRQTGLMGESGPEAIMPLKRGRDGRLGVQATGGGTINLHFHGTIIDQHACMEFATMLYPYTEKLRTWGH